MQLSVDCSLWHVGCGGYRGQPSAACGSYPRNRDSTSVAGSAGIRREGDLACNPVAGRRGANQTLGKSRNRGQFFAARAGNAAVCVVVVVVRLFRVLAI